MDIYKEVTDRIIAQLERGIIPWQKPWIASGNAISHVTGHSYSLLNQMLLGRPGEYVTFAQCQKEGGKIKKGAKSQMVVFWKWVETEDEETLLAGAFKVDWKPVITSRIDTAALKKTMPEIAERFMKQTTTRRFCVR